MNMLNTMPFETLPKQTILGIPFANIDKSQSLSMIDSLYTQRKSNNVFFINAHCINVADQNLDYRNALLKADLVLPDGIGIRIATRFYGNHLKENLNGTDLFPALLQKFTSHKARYYLLGALPGTAAKVAQWIEQYYPELICAGTHHGHFQHNQSDAIVESINASKADVLFVAMGVPQQELWLQQNSHRLNTRLNFAVGGLFEFYSNNIPRAPKVIRAVHCVWLWRLAMEPKRMWKRYIVGSLIFLYKTLLHSFTSRWQQSNTILMFLRQYPNVTRYKAALHFLSKRATLELATGCDRLFDLVVSGLSLIVLSPLMIITSMLIKLESQGPIFFSQIRVGKNGQLFKLYKFRSMCINAEEKLKDIRHLNEKSDGIMFKVKNDPRITTIGRFIRRYSIDELPQLLNVFKGDMTIIGPRPALPAETKAYEISYTQRLYPKPGLLSEWLFLGRNQLSFQQQAQLDIDLFYKPTLFRKLKLILKCIPAIIFGRGAS